VEYVAFLNNRRGPPMPPMKIEPVVPVTQDPMHQFSSILKYLQAPKVDIDSFDGNPLEYLYFITTFEESVEGKVPDQRGRR